MKPSAAGTYNESEVPGRDPNAPNAFVTPRRRRIWPRWWSRRTGSGNCSGRASCPWSRWPARAANPILGGANVQSDDKGAMMERRLAEHVPVVLFTIRLVPGPNGEKAGPSVRCCTQPTGSTTCSFRRQTRNY